MFTLPTLWNLMIATLVFFISAWYAHRQLDRYELPRGMTRNVLVLTVATLLSWGAGELVDMIARPPQTKGASTHALPEVHE